MVRNEEGVVMIPFIEEVAKLYRPPICEEDKDWKRDLPWFEHFIVAYTTALEKRGWKVAPMNPTPEMIAAAEDALSPIACWINMITAAPERPR